MNASFAPALTSKTGLRESQNPGWMARAGRICLWKKRSGNIWANWTFTIPWAVMGWTCESWGRRQMWLWSLSIIFTWRQEKSKITAILKNDKREDPGNYKSESLVLIPEKVMEQFIMETISRHMEEKKIIQISQHPFTKGRSCLTALVSFCNEIISLMGRWRAVGIVFLDCSKAFDTIA